MTTPDRLQAKIEAEAKRIQAWADSEPIWEFCPRDTEWTHQRLCDHQVFQLASHLVHARIQAQDAKVQALREALEEMVDKASVLLSLGDAFGAERRIILGQLEVEGFPNALKQAKAALKLWEEA